MEYCMEPLQKIKTKFPYHPAIYFWTHTQKNWKWELRDVYTFVVLAPLFARDKKVKAD
jgi:hypothetical protein